MKRKILILLGLMVFAGGVVFTCVTYPAGCKRLGADSSRNAAAFWHQITTASSNGKWNRVMPALKKLGSDALDDLIYIDAPATRERAAAASTDKSDIDTPSASDANAPVDVTNPPAWKAPAIFPARSDWTWTTVSGDVYNNVKVVGMEQDSVAIIYSGGGKLIPVTALSPDVQKELGYNPAQYAAVAGQVNKAEAGKQSQQAMSGKWEFDDYNAAQTQAKMTGRHMLLYFTGSDWCPWCQKMDSEILSSSEFRRFALPNFVMVTIDFPHNIPQSDQQKMANQALAQKYGITGYPTLVATDANGKMLATTGYDPSIDAVIGNLAVARITPSSN